MTFDLFYRIFVIIPMGVLGLCFLVCGISESLRNAVAEWWFRQ